MQVRTLCGTHTTTGPRAGVVVTVVTFATLVEVSVVEAWGSLHCGLGHFAGSWEPHQLSYDASLHQGLAMQSKFRTHLPAAGLHAGVGAGVGTGVGVVLAEVVADGAGVVFTVVATVIVFDVDGVGAGVLDATDLDVVVVVVAVLVAGAGAGC